jgi:transposase
VPTKTPEQQSCLTLHRTRHLFIRQQTAIINSIRAHLAEFGIVAPVGRNGVEQLLEVVANVEDTRLPEVARACVAALGTQLRALKAQILAFDRHIMAWHRSNETSKRLDVIPGVGPALATALVASIADPKAFRSGRDFAAWIGLVPKQNSSGGKDKLGSITKRGDRYLRSLFTTGALAVIRSAKLHGTKHRPWLAALLARRPTKVAAIALANKIARMAWAMMGTGEASGERRALLSAEAAIANPLIYDVSMRGARGVLISITGGKDLTLFEVDQAATRIREEVDVDANIIVGATFDENLKGTIRVSVVATGVEINSAASIRLSTLALTTPQIPVPDQRPATIM